MAFKDLFCHSQRVYIPVLVFGFTFFLQQGLQMQQIFRDRASLDETFAAQAQPLEQASRVQDQLRSLLLGTSRLASEGNQAAAQIIADVRRLGISIAPNDNGGGAGAGPGFGGMPQPSSEPIRPPGSGPVPPPATIPPAAAPSSAAHPPAAPLH